MFLYVGFQVIIEFLPNLSDGSHELIGPIFRLYDPFFYCGEVFFAYCYL